jgi:hypothetical protein
MEGSERVMLDDTDSELRLSGIGTRGHTCGLCALSVKGSQGAVVASFAARCARAQDKRAPFDSSIYWDSPGRADRPGVFGALDKRRSPGW